jgi:hypothetical protein
MEKLRKSESAFLLSLTKEAYQGQRRQEGSDLAVTTVLTASYLSVKPKL